jgi:hypothetical protein
MKTHAIKHTRYHLVTIKFLEYYLQFWQHWSNFTSASYFGYEMLSIILCLDKLDCLIGTDMMAVW